MTTTPTASQRRAARWLEESRQEAARLGQMLPSDVFDYFTHLSRCTDCILREHSDPDLCSVAEALLDGDDEEDDQ